MHGSGCGLSNRELVNTLSEKERLLCPSLRWSQEEALRADLSGKLTASSSSEELNASSCSRYEPGKTLYCRWKLLILQTVTERRPGLALSVTDAMTTTSQSILQGCPIVSEGRCFAKEVSIIPVGYHRGNSSADTAAKRQQF